MTRLTPPPPLYWPLLLASAALSWFREKVTFEIWQRAYQFWGVAASAKLFWRQFEARNGQNPCQMDQKAIKTRLPLNFYGLEPKHLYFWTEIGHFLARREVLKSRTRHSQNFIDSNWFFPVFIRKATRLDLYFAFLWFSDALTVSRLWQVAD